MFHWNEGATEAFLALKDAMTHAPVFAMPSFIVPLMLETNASKIGIGAVLMQRGRPITYLSKTIAPKHLG